MTINSQRKGMAGEREVVDILRAHEFQAERTGCYESHDVRCWYDEGDPQYIEVKRRNIGSAAIYELLKANLEVWHRANSQDWMVTLKAKDYLALRLLAK